MKKIVSHISMALFSMILTTGIVNADPDYVANELLIKFKTSTSSTVLSAPSSGMRTMALKSVNATVLNISKNINMEHWRLPAGITTEEAIRQLKQNPNVAIVEPNYKRYIQVLPNDPNIPLQWGVNNTGQTINDNGQLITGVPGADMGLSTAWATQTGSAAVIIAVLDDSIDINHEDLAANIYVNALEVPGDGIDNDGNGFIDDVKGWDFKNNDNDTSADVGAGEGHGTATASTLGAVGNNGIGISGVNWNVSIMPLKFNLDVASEIQAMDYAIANGAQIINTSFGGTSFSILERDEIQLLQNAGILLVASSGNKYRINDLFPIYPAGFTNSNVISVGASDINDNMTPWSNFGGSSVDIVAPGLNIYTAQAANASIGHSGTLGILYDFINGTSFSAPAIAGIAGLIKAQFPAAGFQELKGRIISSATQLTSLQGLVSSGGKANAASALTIAPQPAIVIGQLFWDDGILGDNVINPSENGLITITLDNQWIDATSVSVTVTSLSPNLIINTPTIAYPNILSGGSQTASFDATSTAATDHQIYKIKLDISAAGGYLVTRYYTVSEGTLTDGVLSNNTLGATDHDDYHFFIVDVPAGTSNLSITTASAQNVNLMVTTGKFPPSFDYPNHAVSLPPLNTIMAVTISGNENINIVNPIAGPYTITVLKPDFIPNVAYSVIANLTTSAITPPPPTGGFTVTSGSLSGGSTGGCTISKSSTFDPLMILLILMSLIYIIKPTRAGNS